MTHFLTRCLIRLIARCTAVVFIAVLLLPLGSRVASALTVLNPGNVSLLNSEMVGDLLKSVAIGANYRTLNSASPLGSVIGIDAALEVSTISIPESVKTAMTTAGVTGTVPGYVPIPRFNIQKGLPFGIDIGFSYFQYEDYKLLGTGIKWAFLKGDLVKPAVAVQYSLAYARLFFMQTRTHKIDLLVSKKLGFILDPYAGFGWELGSGELNVPLTGPMGLSTTVSAHQSFNAPHLFIGFPIKLLLTKISAEYDYSFSGIKTIGAKLSIMF